MKKILTILLICVAATGWSQNIFRYAVIDSNDVTIAAATFGNLSRSPILNLRNNYARIFQNYRISQRGFNMNFDSINFFQVSSAAYPSGLLLIGGGSSTLGDGSVDVNGTAITVDDPSMLITIGTTTTNVLVNGDSAIFQGDIIPLTASDLNIGSATAHYDTAFIDHIIPAPTVTSFGVYKPDTSDGADITDFVIDSAGYTRVGNVVSVFGFVSDVSTTGAASIQLNLPISSNIARVGQLTGVVNSGNGTTAEMYIIGNTSTEKAVLHLPTLLSNAILTFTFFYLVY